MPSFSQLQPASSAVAGVALGSKPSRVGRFRLQGAWLMDWVQTRESAGVQYRVRVSRRARRLGLRVLADGKVEVVLPEGVSREAAHAFVHSKAAWIARVRSRLAPAWAERRGACRRAPEAIALTALGEVWRLELQDRPERRPVLSSEGKDLLRFVGPVGDGTACRQLLRGWVKERARRILPDWLARVSRETGLIYERVQVRGQRSRWGSCSARRHISLNYKLLFLPPEVVRYLLVHELCHTRRLDHSARFWGLVEGYCPDYRELDALLRRPGTLLPAWLECE